MPSDTGFQVTVDISPEDVLGHLSLIGVIDFIDDLVDGMPDEAIELLCRRLGDLPHTGGRGQAELAAASEEDLLRDLESSEEGDAQAGG